MGKCFSTTQGVTTDSQSQPIAQNKVKPASPKNTEANPLRKTNSARKHGRNTLAHRLSSIIMLTIEGELSTDETGVDRERLRQIFEDVDVPVEAKLFDAVFLLFDINGDGKVNRSEFVTAMAFMLEENSRPMDRYLMAFELFDSSRSGSISREEFNDMYNILFGTELKYLFRIPQGVPALEQFLKKEHSSETVMFWKALQTLRMEAVNWPTDILESKLGVSTVDSEGNKTTMSSKCFPLQSARKLIAEYIKEDSRQQVNVAAAMRERVMDCLELSENVCKQHVPEAANCVLNIPGWIRDNLFDEIEAEVLKLVEQDSLTRFKRALKQKSGRYDFSKLVWEEFSIEDGMTQADFANWANKYPESFSFLDDLHKSLATCRGTGFNQSLERKSLSLFYDDGRNLLSFGLVDRIAKYISQLGQKQPMVRKDFDGCVEVLSELSSQLSQASMDLARKTFDVVAHGGDTCLLVRFLTSWALAENHGTRTQSRQLLFRLFDHNCCKYLDEKCVKDLIISMVDLELHDTMFAFQECVQSIRIWRSNSVSVNGKDQLEGSQVASGLDDISLLEHLCDLEECADYVAYEKVLPILRKKADLAPYVLLEGDAQTATVAKAISSALSDSSTTTEAAVSLLKESVNIMKSRLDLNIFSNLRKQIEETGDWVGLERFVWEVVDKKCNGRVSVPNAYVEGDRPPAVLYHSQYMLWTAGRFNRTVQGCVLKEISEHPKLRTVSSHGSNISGATRRPSRRVSKVNLPECDQEQVRLPEDTPTGGILKQ